MTTDRWPGDGLDPEDMAIPEIKLIQNVGGQDAKVVGAKPGDFYSALTGEIIPSSTGFDLIIVAMRKNRTYWGRTEIDDEPPVCASMDAKSMESINGKDCSDCPHRCETPWLLSSTERREKCLVNYNILGILPEGQMPVLIRATGISAQSSKQLYTQLSLNKELKGEWYKAKTHITSIPKKSSAGDAFAIVFGKLDLVQDVKQLADLKTQSIQLLGTQILLPEGRPEEEVEPEPEPEPTPGPEAEAKVEKKAQQPAPAVKPKKPAKPTAAPTPSPTANEPEPPVEEKRKELIDFDF